MTFFDIRRCEEICGESWDGKQQVYGHDKFPRFM